MSVVSQLETIEASRKKTSTAVLVLFLIASALLIASVIVLFYPIITDNYSIDFTYTFVPFFILLIVSAILFFIGCALASSFRKKHQIDFIRDILNELYDAPIYEMRNKLPLGTIMEPGFFVHPDLYEGCNLLSATANGIYFECAEYTLLKCIQTKDHVTYQPYASGTFVIFNYEALMPGKIKIVEKGFMDGLFAGSHKVELESINFNKKFLTTTNNNLLTFYLLTPQIQGKILELEKSFKGKLYLFISDNRLLVALDSLKLSINLSLWKKIDENYVKSIMDKLSLPKQIVECLGLNEEKYKRSPSL